jgi:hypothetical protein
LIKESIQQEEIIILNICAPNIRVLKYKKQIWIDLKGKIGHNTIIVGDFGTLLSAMGK